MLDSIKMILAGFAGRYRNYPKSRNLIWWLISSFALGWLATVFNVWLSRPGYEGMIPPVANADVVALGFCVGVAGFVFVVLAQVAGFIMERALKVPKPHQGYAVVGFVMALVSVAVFVPTDYFMQTQGAFHHAAKIAGSRQESKYDGTKAAENMAFIRQQIQEITTGKSYYGSYGWKDKKDGKYKLNRTGEREVLKLRDQLAAAQAADVADQATKVADRDAANTRRDELEARTHATLNKGAWGVWVLILISCLSQAYCVEQIQAEVGGYAIKGQAMPDPITQRIRIEEYEKEFPNPFQRLWNWLNPQLAPDVAIASAPGPIADDQAEKRPNQIGYKNEQAEPFKQEGSLFKQGRRGNYTPEMKEVLSHISSSNNKLKQAERRLRVGEGLPETNQKTIAQMQAEIETARAKLSHLQQTS